MNYLKILENTVNTMKDEKFKSEEEESSKEEEKAINYLAQGREDPGPPPLFPQGIPGWEWTSQRDGFN